MMALRAVEIDPAALLPRTDRTFYAAWVKLAREIGVPEKDIDTHIAQNIRDTRALINGKCPQCGAPAIKYSDSAMRYGPSGLRGEWFMYRCSTQPPPGQFRDPGVCDFMMDQLEAT